MPNEVEQRLREIEERVSKAIEGPYHPIWDACDCGGGYPCGHPDWIYALRLSVPVEGKAGDDYHDFYYSELGEFPPETVEFFAHAREDVPWLTSLLREREEENRRLRQIIADVRRLVETLAPDNPEVRA